MEKLARTWKMWVFVKPDRFVLIILFLIVQCYWCLCYRFPFVYKSTVSVRHCKCCLSNLHTCFMQQASSKTNSPTCQFFIGKFSIGTRSSRLSWNVNALKYNVSYEIFLIFLFPKIQFIWSCLHYTGATSLYPMNIRRWKKLSESIPAVLLSRSKHFGQKRS